MNEYQVRFPDKRTSDKFRSALESIPRKSIRNKITQDILKLASDPRPYGTPKLKPPLKVFYKYLAQYRIRIGDYRVLYDVDDKKRVVWILVLRKRSEATYK